MLRVLNSSRSIRFTLTRTAYACNGHVLAVPNFSSRFISNNNASTQIVIPDADFDSRWPQLHQQGWQLVSMADKSKRCVGQSIVDSTGRGIEKVYTLKDYARTWAFLTQISMKSHVVRHHPYVETQYNKVKITLHTDDIQNLSPLDLDLAQSFDKYAVGLTKKVITK